MKVHIPTPLQSYTGNQNLVECSGKTVAQLFDHLDQLYPGIRFRMISEQDTIRAHINIFVNDRLVRDLSTNLAGTEEIHIICALSGGA